jgi:hypothetical protein
MQKVRIGAFGVALIMVSVLSACSAGSHTVTVDAGAQRTAAARQLVLTAASTTDALTTGRFTATTSITGGSVGSSLGGPLTVTGAFDRAQQATEATVSGKGAQDLGLSTIVIGGVSYVKIGDLGQMLGLKKPWISVDVGQLARSHGLTTKLPGASGTNDPASFLDLLRGVSTHVTTIGNETVSGVSTTHILAEVVPSQALTEIPADRRAELNRALQSLDGALGTQVRRDLATPITVNVWIDAAGHVIKGSETVTEGSLGTIATTYVLTDLGQPVSIVAPPSSEVTPAASIPVFKTLLGH